MLAPPGLPHGPPSPLNGTPTQIRTYHAGRQSPEIGMPFNQGEYCLPQGCIGSRGSQSEAVSSYPCVAEAQPGTIKKIFLFCFTLSPRSATETDLEDTLGGDDDAAEGDRDNDMAELAVSVFSFLGDLVQVSPFDVDSRSSE